MQRRPRLTGTSAPRGDGRACTKLLGNETARWRLIAEPLTPEAFALLRVDHIRIAHLPPLSFTVASGECLSVEGPSGTGKTRLLRAIADLDPVDGQVFVDGGERREMAAHTWRRRVRYVSAEAGWWGETARTHLPSLPRVGRLIDALGLDRGSLDRPISQLSTGERQRLALIRAIVDEPRVLLLDEPTAALDADTAALTDEVIRFETLAGRCVVLVSHNPVEVQRLAHARLILAADPARDTPTATQISTVRPTPTRNASA